MQYERSVISVELPKLQFRYPNFVRYTRFVALNVEINLCSCFPYNLILHDFVLNGKIIILLKRLTINVRMHDLN